MSIKREEFDILVPSGKGGKGGKSGPSPKGILPWPPSENSGGAGDADSDDVPKGGDGKGAVKVVDIPKEGPGVKNGHGIGGVISKAEGARICEALGETPEELSRDEIDRIAKQAVTKMPSGEKGPYGDSAGMLKRRMAEIYKPQVDWKQALRTFVGRALSPKHEDRISDRRHPGLYTTQEKKKENAITKFVAAVDTSGSMGDDELGIILSEIKAIVEEKKVQTTTIVYFDVVVDLVRRLVGKGAVKAYKGEAVGGGGTNFRPPLEKMNEIYNKEGFGVAVFLTDGFADLKLPKPRFAEKFIWVILDNASFEAPWGLKTIHITKEHLKVIRNNNK